MQSAAALREGLHLADWTTVDLWRAALGIGGELTTGDVAELAAGLREPTHVEHDILASALNDHLVGRGQDHPVPYWAQLHPA